jgi:hypothetical protein
MFDLQELFSFDLQKWVQWFVLLYINFVVYLKEIYHWILSKIPKKWQRIKEKQNTMVLWKDGNGQLTNYEFNATGLEDVANKMRQMTLPSVVVYETPEFEFVRNWDGKLDNGVVFEIPQIKSKPFSFVELTKKNEPNKKYELHLDEKTFYVGNEILSFLHIAKLFFAKYAEKLTDEYDVFIVEDDLETELHLTQGQFIKIGQEGKYEVLEVV